MSSEGLPALVVACALRWSVLADLCVTPCLHLISIRPPSLLFPKPSKTCLFVSTERGARAAVQDVLRPHSRLQAPIPGARRRWHCVPGTAAAALQRLLAARRILGAACNLFPAQTGGTTADASCWMPPADAPAVGCLPNPQEAATRYYELSQVGKRKIGDHEVGASLARGNRCEIT